MNTSALMKAGSCGISRIAIVLFNERRNLKSALLIG